MPSETSYGVMWQGPPIEWGETLLFVTLGITNGFLVMSTG